MSNFEFLRGQKEYALFAPAAIEAEKVFATSRRCVPSAPEKHWSSR